MKITQSHNQFGFVLIILVFISSVDIFGQTSKHELFETLEKTAGVNYAYPGNDISTFTPAPTGFIPFYISHFGRHGSRYLVSDKEYGDVLHFFLKADSCNALTTLGKDVLIRLKNIWSTVEGKGGTLTPLGISQLEGIAERMYRNYPEVFCPEAKLYAVSTTVGRCIESMEIFAKQIQKLNPELVFSTDANPVHMNYLNFHTEEAIRFRNYNTWRKNYLVFEKHKVRHRRLINSLFNSNNFIKDYPQDELVWKLYNIASNLQNFSSAITLYDIFDKKELFDLWQCKNYSWYVQYANASINGGIMFENAKPLLYNIIKKANNIINSRSIGVDLRFGHDGNIIPLAMILYLKDCYNIESNPNYYYKAWSDFKIALMGGNIQIIFYRKNACDDVLVKFIQNEREVAIPPVKAYSYPYYKWSDLVNFYNVILNKYN